MHLPDAGAPAKRLRGETLENTPNPLTTWMILLAAGLVGIIGIGAAIPVARSLRARG